MRETERECEKKFNLAMSMSKTAALPKLTAVAFHELLAEDGLVLWAGHLVSNMAHRRDIGMNCETVIEYHRSSHPSFFSLSISLHLFHYPFSSLFFLCLILSALFIFFTHPSVTSLFSFSRIVHKRTDKHTNRATFGCPPPPPFELLSSLVPWANIHLVPYVQRP